MKSFKKKRGMCSVLKLFLAFCVLISSVFFSLPAFAAGTPNNVTYVAFSSDVHNTSGDASSKRLDNWINTVTGKLGSKFDNMGFTGDLGPGSGRSSDYWSNAQKVMDVVKSSTNVNQNGFYVCGNHEYNPGSYSHNTNQTTKNYSDAGTYQEGDGYILYSVGATQGYEEYTEATRTALSSFLEEHKSYDGPIFVLGHYPLHYYGGTSGESTTIHDGKAAKYSKEMIEIMNGYPNVIFLWGHNHSSSNDHYDQVYTDKINNTGINFTYAAAGCMSDNEYGFSANVKGKGLVAAIEDGFVTLTYYDKSGNVVETPTKVSLNGGSEDPTPEKPVDEISVTPKQGGTTYPKGVTIAVGESITVHVTNESSNSAYDFTTTFEKNGIASADPSTVNIGEGATKDVVIKGLKEGETKVTISNKNQYGSQYTRSVVINLKVTKKGGDTPEPLETKNVYTLTNHFEMGKTYLIVTVDNGSGVALANNSSNSFTTVDVTVADNKIQQDDLGSAEWTAVEASSQTTIGLKNGSNVLKVDASNSRSPYIKTSGTSYNAGGFGYTEGNHVSYPYGDPAKDYFIGSGDETFKASSSESGLGKVYIFVKGEGSEDPTPEEPVDEISVTPVKGGTTYSKDVTIAVGESVTVHVTNGSENDSYDFTTTFENNGIASANPATVNIGKGATKDVVIKGLKEGETKVTISNKNQYGSQYTRSAVINLIVTDEGGSEEPTPEEYEVTFEMNGHGNQVEAQRVTAGQTAQEPTAPTADGYDFGGWYADTELSEVFNFASTINEDTTVYAKWTEKEPEIPTGETVYTLTDQFKMGEIYLIVTVIDGQGVALANNSSTFATEKVTVADKKIQQDGLDKAEWTAVEASSKTTIGLKNGSNVLKINGSGTPSIKTDATSYNAGGFGYTAGNHVSYPHHQKDYFIGSAARTFKASGSGSGLGKVYIFVKGEGSSEDPTPEEYEVTFEMNGHGTQVEAQKVTAGQTAQEPTAPTADGYDFGGWYADIELSEEFNFASKINADTTLYAKWTEKEPEIPTGETVYTLTDHFEMGETYLIVTVKDGQGVALANNNSNSFATVKVNVAENKIQQDDLGSAEWTAVEASSKTTIGLQNGKNVLKVDAQNQSNPYIKTSATSYNAGGFGYTEGNHVSYPYNQKDYFIGSAAGTFKASGSESGLGKVYIFVKGEGGSEDPTPEVHNLYNEGATYRFDAENLIVQSDLACVVVAELSNGGYERLTAVQRDDGTYGFDFSKLSGKFSLHIALRGDADLNGVIDMGDAQVLMLSWVNEEPLEGVAVFAADVDEGDNMSDAAAIMLSWVNDTGFNWN